LNYLLKIKPEKVAIQEMRTHTAHYLKGLMVSFIVTVSNYLVKIINLV